MPLHLPCGPEGTIERKLRSLKGALARFIRDDSGATAIEYGLIAALISVTAIATLKGAGTKMNGKFVAASNGLN